MGSTTAALPKKLQNAITERMRLSLLRGDTPFDKARLADAAQFIGELASQRTRGRSAMAIESISDERRLTRIAIINDDMPFLVDSDRRDHRRAGSVDRPAGASGHPGGTRQQGQARGEFPTAIPTTHSGNR